MKRLKLEAILNARFAFNKSLFHTRSTHAVIQEIATSLTSLDFILIKSLFSRVSLRWRLVISNDRLFLLLLCQWRFRGMEIFSMKHIWNLLTFWEEFSILLYDERWSPVQLCKHLKVSSSIAIKNTFFQLCYAVLEGQHEIQIISEYLALVWMSTYLSLSLYFTFMW